MSLEMCTQPKKPGQQFCSGCARRGHLIHTCRVTLPFSGLPINSPHVQLYRPIYAQSHTPNKPARSKSFSEDMQRPDRNAKRLSKSPTVHETHVNKKRNIPVDDTEINAKSLSPAQKNTKEGDNTPKNKNKNLNKSVDSVTAAEKALDFIHVEPRSSNHDNKGRVIQDNDVSDTSDAITSSRIYVTNDIINKLKMKEGEDWLKEMTGKLNVSVGPSDVNSFLNITGKVAEQEVFQTKLREWVQTNIKKPKNSSTPAAENSDESKSWSCIPKNRNNLLRHLDKALGSLNDDLGDPLALFKHLTCSRNFHEKLKKQKVVSPERLLNSRTHINQTLKKLNIILVGQAGLGDGSAHLNQLMSLQQKIMSSRDKNISVSMRKEIGEHYQCIFSSNARDDYSELLDKYYVGNPGKVSKKKKKRKGNNPDQETTDVSKRSIPCDENERVEAVPTPLISEAEYKAIKNAKCLKDLVYFSKRLTNLRDSGAYPNSKSEMQQLLRKIHPCIVVLHRNKILNSKQTKKVTKTQQEVRKFLARM